jgi:hypothetical protein
MGIATRWRSPGLWIRKSKISYGRLELEFFPSLPPTGTIKSAVNLRISNDSPPTPFDINQLHLTIALSQKRF